MPDFGHRLACGLVALANVFMAMAIVLVWKLGPVVAVIDGGAGHGLHEGDLLALPLLAMATLWFGRAAGLLLLPARATLPRRSR